MTNPSPLESHGHAPKKRELYIATANKSGHSFIFNWYQLYTSEQREIILGLCLLTRREYREIRDPEKTSLMIKRANEYGLIDRLIRLTARTLQARERS